MIVHVELLLLLLEKKNQWRDESTGESESLEPG